MIKHIVLLVVLSLAVVFFRHELVILMNGVVSLHQHLMDVFAKVFSADPLGALIQSSLALVTIPFVIGLVLACLLWILRRKLTPWLPELMWGIWLVAMTLVLIQGNM